jgi:aspartyl-tRNA(Asn)/glutamyl-tRNA(Gln) amidotransferase subunit B
MPGTLPSPNKAAVESIILAGLATSCSIEKHTMFYRKHYFYPDLTNNYQVTQGPVAFCMRGGLDLEVVGSSAAQRTHREGTRPLGQCEESKHSVPQGNKGSSSAMLEDSYVTHIGITRIHLEEDAGKLVHVGGESGRISGADYSLVDYNRCGTGLIELVTEPDLRTPEEARLFLQKLRLIYLTLGISDCSMEKGSLRCDGNISLRRRGTEKFGTKTELKNMNSFKNLHDGLAYEICRQAEVLEDGGRIVQETRHWEPATRRTIGMRSKESVEDYCLFPDPNLTPIILSDTYIEEIRSRLPELPDARIARYITNLQLSASDARTLIGDIDLAHFFDAALSCGPKTAQRAIPLANLLINEVSAYLNAQSLSLSQTKLSPEHLSELIQLVAQEEISSKQGKEVLVEVIERGVSPQALVKELGIAQVSDAGEIEAVAKQILSENPQKVAEYQAGKTGLLGFFVGQAMKATNGMANPKLVNEVFLKLLDLK